jgi:hypothetical protein
MKQKIETEEQPEKPVEIIQSLSEISDKHKNSAPVPAHIKSSLRKAHVCEELDEKPHKDAPPHKESKSNHSLAFSGIRLGMQNQNFQMMKVFPMSLLRILCGKGVRLLALAPSDILFG